MSQEHFEEIDRRLETLETQVAQVKNQLSGNTSSIARLETLGSELLDIAQLHQRALRISQQREEEDRAEIRRIWEYLLGQQRNGNGSRE